MSGNQAPEPNFQADQLTVKMRVTLAADKSAVDPVVQGIMEIVRKMQYSKGKEDAIELALGEALANAVVHGAKADPAKIIECDVACDEAGGMLIVVRDPGTGFPGNSRLHRWGKCLFQSRPWKQFKLLDPVETS